MTLPLAGTLIGQYNLILSYLILSYTVYMFISILYLLLYIYVFSVPLYMVYENKDD